jgi:hypothetical protein
MHEGLGRNRCSASASVVFFLADKRLFARHRERLGLNQVIDETWFEDQVIYSEMEGGISGIAVV